MYQLAILYGDGIGKEIVTSTDHILFTLEELLGKKLFKRVYLPIGLESYKLNQATYPTSTVNELRSCHGAVLGPLTTHIYNLEAGMPNPSGKMRKEFDLYANLRPIKSIPGKVTPFPNIDLLIVRENTEGMYSDRNLFQGNGEFMPDDEHVLSLRVVSRKGSSRIAKKAFEMAQSRNKKHVSAVHKANVLRKGCGLFLEECKKVAESYPEIILDDFHIDAFAMYLILNPQKYDVIVTTNMFGDILSDEAAGLVGGLGLAPGLNMGDTFAIAQAAHGSAPTIAGQNKANPIAEILSMKMLLDWLGKKNNDQDLINGSKLIDRAVWKTLEEGTILTPDLGGEATTSEITLEISHKLLNDAPKVSKL